MCAGSAQKSDSQKENNQTAIIDILMGKKEETSEQLEVLSDIETIALIHLSMVLISDPLVVQQWNRMSNIVIDFENAKVFWFYPVNILVL